MIPLVDLKKQYLSIKREIDSAIQNTIENATFIMGVPVREFEENLAKFCGCEYALGVSSGSSALFLALKAYGIKEGDEVITVPNSFIATVESIIQCGGKPVFVDVDENTMLMDTTKLEERISSKTKAIIPVHLCGQICEMDPIINIAKKHGLIILEDAAQAIDAEYKNRKLPIYETAILSFFPAKNLGGYGDGGAVVTNNRSVAEMVCKLRDHGRIDKYESDVVGYGERLDALQAAILGVKLKYVKEWSEKRRKNACKYDELLKNLEEISIPSTRKYSTDVYYLYVIRTTKRDELVSFLKEQGIATGIHYPIPLHLQPSLKFLGYKERDFPVTEKLAKEILSIPMYPELTEKEIEFICKKIKFFFS
jgi:dTDP-4-amino-4,6-dideoxygalactose transaminase